VERDWPLFVLNDLERRKKAAALTVAPIRGGDPAVNDPAHRDKLPTRCRGEGKKGGGAPSKALGKKGSWLRNTSKASASESKRAKGQSCVSIAVRGEKKLAIRFHRHW